MPKICYMSCHFAPDGPGISNLPKQLPPGSILMLDDWMPPQNHDPALVSQQLQSALETLGCGSLLLDFQRPQREETAQMVRGILERCPAVVSAPYAGGLDCPVLLPPIPLNKTPESHLAPWAGRELWVEVALEAMTAAVTETGTCFSSADLPEAPLPHFDEALCCHYGLSLSENAAVFTLYRTWADLQKMMATEGVTAWVGLFQELKKEL